MDPPRLPAQEHSAEQHLAIDAVWALFAAFYAVGFGVAGLRWSLSPLVAFAIFKAAIAARKQAMAFE